jgi:predicted pyridoxine 5'-phosphate oxidase superfamily flavin-nucleotide-binding protein
MSGEQDLQSRLGSVDRAERFYRDQVLDRLNARMVAFVARTEMAFIATSDRAGACDASFRAGPPGFLHVIDEHTIAYPEYRGNGVCASMGNIDENPHIAILLIDFVRDLIGLHINGTARLVDDETLRSQVRNLPPVTMPGRAPELWVLVTVEQAYIHCRKHIPRMVYVTRERLWGSDDIGTKGGDYFGAKNDGCAR